MKIRHVTVASFCALLSLAGCNKKEEKKEKEEAAASGPTVVRTAVDTLSLPAPYATESVSKESKLVGWSEGQAPKAPVGFVVTKFADNLKNPRWSYVAPNGDIFVVESDDKKKSANQITLFRDQNNDGKPDLRQVFIEDLSQPFGMLVLNNYFYVANTDGITRYPYKPGQTKLEGKGQKIMELPAGGYNHHWTRNIIASPDGAKIYVSVGSASNVGEYGMDEEKRRACILQINPDGSGEKIYASGLRNPVGMDWAPGTNVLWTSVNERDELGDNLVPDYLTSVKEGGFYGWPYSYFGQIVDPRRKDERPDLVAKAIVPEVALGSHTASLGLTFYDKDQFPAKYRNGAFIGQHGSWNRSQLAGYKVLFVPFKDGKPAGKPEDFLTGFVEDLEEDQVHGRPSGVTVLPDGSLLVNDDKGNTLWRVSTR